MRVRDFLILDKHMINGTKVYKINFISVLFSGKAEEKGGDKRVKDIK